MRSYAQSGQYHTSVERIPLHDMRPPGEVQNKTMRSYAQSEQYRTSVESHDF